MKKNSGKYLIIEPSTCASGGHLVPTSLLPLSLFYPIPPKRIRKKDSDLLGPVLVGAGTLVGNVNPELLQLCSRRRTELKMLHKSAAALQLCCFQNLADIFAGS